LIGNSLMGFMADAWGVGPALMVGGLTAAVGCLMLGRLLTPFWYYRAPTS